MERSSALKQIYNGFNLQFEKKGLQIAEWFGHLSDEDITLYFSNEQLDDAAKVNTLVQVLVIMEAQSGKSEDLDRIQEQTLLINRLKRVQAQQFQADIDKLAEAKLDDMDLDTLKHFAAKAKDLEQSRIVDYMYGRSNDIILVQTTTQIIARLNEAIEKLNLRT